MPHSLEAEGSPWDKARALSSPFSSFSDAGAIPWVACCLPKVHSLCTFEDKPGGNTVQQWTPDMSHFVSSALSDLVGVCLCFLLHAPLTQKWHWIFFLLKIKLCFRRDLCAPSQPVLTSFQTVIFSAVVVPHAQSNPKAMNGKCQKQAVMIHVFNKCFHSVSWGFLKS